MSVSTSRAKPISVDWLAAPGDQRNGLLRLTARLAIVLLVPVLISCDRTSLPDVPDFESLGFADAQKPVRLQMATVYEQWQEAPQDAERNGRLGMHLSVYGKHRAAAIVYERARTLAPAEFRWAYYHAFAFREMGRYDEAIRIFREALGLDPAHAEARLNLAGLLLQSNQNEESLRLYEGITTEFPGRVEGWFGLGKVHARMNNHDAAVTALRRARLMGPEYSEIRYALAVALRAAGDHEGAKREFDGYERMADKRIQMTDPLLAAVTALHAGDEPHLARANRLLGRAQVDLQFRKAAGAFRDALAINPTKQGAWVGLVSAYGAIGDKQATANAYREALAAGVSYARLDLTYGRLLLDWEDYDAAREVLARAVVRDPQYADAYAATGELELRRGAPVAAVEQFRLALAAKPNDVGTALLLGQALNASEQYAQAVGLLLRFANNTGSDKALVLKELAIANEGLGRRDEAIAVLLKSREAATGSGNASLRQEIEELLSQWR